MTRKVPSGRAARTASLRTQDIIDGLGDGFFALDADWRFTECNRAAETYAQLRREEVIGRVYWEVAPAAEGSALGEMFRRVMATRAPEEADAPAAIRPGKVLALRVFAVADGIGVIFRDVTELRQAEARIRESEARFRILADCMPAPAWTTSAAGPIEFVNQAMADWVGRDRASLTGDAWLELLHPDDLEKIVAARAKARAGPDPYVYEARFRRADGAWRLMQVSSRPRFDDGVFEGYVGVAMDVTDIRAAELRQRLLINELNHRVKNTLATVQSLARQTLRDQEAPAAAREGLTERLLALSAAHNVLTRENWETAEVAEIAAEAVRPYDDRGRISLAGPKVRLAPNAALAVSMALHELSTNALKHGALSAPEGRVSVEWREAGDALLISWRERGGPPVRAPARRGFGSRLLGHGLSVELGAAASMSFAPEGLTCEIRAPRAPS